MAELVVGQNLFGTKIKREKEPVTAVERTNILTLIDKAEKLSGNPGLRGLYDHLCDTVHPSIGSNRCFWVKEPTGEDGPVYQFVTERTAKGPFSDLPFTIGMSTLWGLTWLSWMWNNFDRVRKDICLTAKIYALPVEYYGVLRPGNAGELCPCGSTMLAEICPHHFGRAVNDSSATSTRKRV
jgi:hypothetical protein